MSFPRAGALTALLALATLVAGPLAAAEDGATASGEQIATAGNGNGSAPCMSCHGADGSGNAAGGFPVIAGQDAGYMARQLTLIREGERTSPVMAPIVSSLTDDEIQAVAAYYGAMPKVASSAESPAEDAAAVALALVEDGDWPGRDLPACNRCHGPGARGVDASFPACNRCHGPGARGVDASFPGLAGQHASYLKSQLEAFRDGTRKTDPGDLMGTVARKLTDDEIAALSGWLAAQPAVRPEAN